MTVKCDCSLHTAVSNEKHRPSHRFFAMQQPTRRSFTLCRACDSWIEEGVPCKRCLDRGEMADCVLADLLYKYHVERPAMRTISTGGGC